METITLAGGCFWCTEAIFKRLRGVINVTSGYAGGQMDHPTYEQVLSGNTGYAESIQIKFDPKIISLKQILEVFWQLIDPTTLNKQGADMGTQYRSVIFYQNNSQKDIAQKSKQQLEHSKIYPDPIVTKIEPLHKFYPAENYHQNFYDKNPSQTYCKIVINPKIEKLIANFGKIVK